MPSAFISYRRIPSAMLAQLLARELKVHGITAYVDVRQTDGGGPFPTRLLRAIEENDVFVCLVADTTFDSDWVKTEIEHAHTLGKVMFPVFQESYTPLHDPPNESIRALLDSDGVKVLDRQNLFVDDAIEDIADMIKATVRKPVSGMFPRPKTPGRARPYWILSAVFAVLVLVAAMFALNVLSSEANEIRTTLQPADVTVGLNETFTVELTIENIGLEAVNVNGVGVDKSLLDGIAVVQIDPSYRAVLKRNYPLYGNWYEYEMDRSIFGEEKLSVILTFRATRVGQFSGDVTVWIDSEIAGGVTVSRARRAQLNVSVQ